MFIVYNVFVHFPIECLFLSGSLYNLCCIFFKCVVFWATTNIVDWVLLTTSQGFYNPHLQTLPHSSYKPVLEAKETRRHRSSLVMTITLFLVPISLLLTFLITMTSYLTERFLKKDWFWLMVSDDSALAHLTPYSWAKHYGNKRVFTSWLARKQRMKQEAAKINILSTDIPSVTNINILHFSLLTWRVLPFSHQVSSVHYTYWFCLFGVVNNTAVSRAVQVLI